ncbi:MAG: heparan-alpha-glucosaminide N-acetyltransferase domain-containing protein, partial [Clostridia bacterium]
MSITKSNNRVHFIDEIRGFSIICMVFYHLAYSINYFHLMGNFSFNIPFLNEPWMNFLRDLFVGIFVFVSGMSCNLSKNNIKRGILTIILAFIVSFVTYVFVPSNLILFGILHMLGFCMLIYGLIKKSVNKLNNFVFVPIFIVLFLF